MSSPSATETTVGSRAQFETTFPHPEGVSQQYLQQLDQLFFQNTRMYDSYERTVFPLSQTFREVFRLLKPSLPSHQLELQFVGCGTQGAVEAWAAYIAGMQEGISISCTGVDVSVNGLATSQHQALELHQAGAIKADTLRLRNGDANDIHSLDQRDPKLPLFILLRNPFHDRHDVEDPRGFDYQNIMTNVVLKVEEKAAASSVGLCMIIDSSRNIYDVQQTQLRVGQALQASHSRGIVNLGQFRNPFSNRKISHDDGVITLVGPPTISPIPWQIYA